MLDALGRLSFARGRETRRRTILAERRKSLRLGSVRSQMGSKKPEGLVQGGLGFKLDGDHARQQSGHLLFAQLRGRQPRSRLDPQDKRKDTPMALEHLYQLVEEVQDLQEAAKGSVEPDKVRALARLVLELAQAVEDIHDRLQKLEAAPPQSN